MSEDEKQYRGNNVCRLCEKEPFLSDKVGDHSHLAGDYRSPAHQPCNFEVTQNHSNLIPSVFHSFSNYDC